MEVGCKEEVQSASATMSVRDRCCTYNRRLSWELKMLVMMKGKKEKRRTEEAGGGFIE